MLNSRYAPVIALAVLGIIVVLALGYFLAVSPVLSEGAEIRDRATAVDDNTAQIDLMAARIDQYDADLQAAPDFGPAVELNAPAVYDVEAVRNRLAGAVESSGVGLIQVTGSGVSPVAGLEATASARISNQVAALFTQGPVDPAPEAEAFTPAVVPDAQGGVVVERLYGVPLTFSVTGSPQEVMAFFTSITDSAQPVMQFPSMSLDARQADEAPIPGVPNAEDGDVIAELSGFVYLLDPSEEVVDEESLTSASLPGTSPFEQVAGTGATEE